MRAHSRPSRPEGPAAVGRLPLRRRLLAEARRRRNLDKGAAANIADLGAALLNLPADRGKMRALLRAAIEDAGGYARLAKAVAADEPELG
jgi:hypothetical protein